MYIIIREGAVQAIFPGLDLSILLEVLCVGVHPDDYSSDVQPGSQSFGTS